MKAVELDAARLGDFKAFCVASRDKVDGSYLSDEDLQGFIAGEADPTYVLLGCDGSIAGAGSLMLTRKALAASKARLRILWCPKGEEKDYSCLLAALFRNSAGIDSAYLFAPLEDAHLSGILDALGFNVERNVYSLMRDAALPPGKVLLPPGFAIRPFALGADEDEWCRIRNAAFATVKGNEAPQSPADIVQMGSSADRIDGAMLVLEESGRAVAVARGSRDELEGNPVMNIGPIAVMPERQGMGLGRALLRSLVSLASQKGFSVTTLSVNADNETALRLYISEGFTKLRCFACRSVKRPLPL